MASAVASYESHLSFACYDYSCPASLSLGAMLVVPSSPLPPSSSVFSSLILLSPPSRRALPSLTQVDPHCCALSHTCREKERERRGKDGDAEEWEGGKEREIPVEAKPSAGPYHCFRGPLCHRRHLYVFVCANEI